ncbi:MAG: leader peptidase (prepilin peptidase) / N-methyltransferase [Chloroflexia bacterium]|nr:leader peptidase (prepilin peptidase) / N-methyltransferase [Chloroflexia bacterium]
MGFVYVAVALVLGLFAGFGVNLIATRLAAQKPMFGPLHCTRAPHRISWVQAFPVFGYLTQGGKCSQCGGRLSLAFPATELATGVLLGGLAWFEGLGLSFVLHAAYVLVLMLVLVIDWKHRDIYFSIIALGSLFALAGLFLLPGMDLLGGVLGAGVAGGFFLLAYLLARLIFPHIEEPLGLGDVLLALMMGLMLGFPNVVGALLIGPLIAGAAAILLLLLRKSKIGDFMPYGVALCAATILFIIYPQPFADALQLPALNYLVGAIFR